MFELPPLPKPYPYLRVGYFHARSLPAHVGRRVNLAEADIGKALNSGLDAVIVSAEGSQETIDPQILELILACEIAAVPIVLRLSHKEELLSPVASVVTHVVTEDDVVYQMALNQFGPERTFKIQSPVDAKSLVSKIDEIDEGYAAQEIARNRKLIIEGSATRQASRFVEFIGMPTEPSPLVTVLIVSRSSENLKSMLSNLRRQNYDAIDPLLIVDPANEDHARAVASNWDLPLRVIAANANSSLGDRLNLGVLHAFGQIVAVMEDRAVYGSNYLVDQVHALQFSGAHLVGKSSWFTATLKNGGVKLVSPKKQWRFDQNPILESIVFHRQTGEVFGFSRASSEPHLSLAKSVRSAGGSVFVSHAYDTIISSAGESQIAFERLESRRWTAGGVGDDS